jgi:hypothetical protein
MNISESWSEQNSGGQTGSGGKCVGSKAVSFLKKNSF